MQERGEGGNERDEGLEGRGWSRKWRVRELESRKGLCKRPRHTLSCR